jgi:uncharacterized membrane protein YjgN (DUF898 family)
MEEQSSTNEQSLKFTPVSFDFHGKAVEFWKIWIVNVLLSVITLGIYSAWAKVRTLRYFYGNTELDGHRFNYLATPIQVLKGRVIAVVLFGLYYLISSLFPAVGLVLMLILLFLFPFFICSSLRFNLRMSSYRNVKFDFKGQYGQALVNFLILPIASLFTLYLALPWVLKRIDNFLISNVQYGGKQFQPELSTSKYYGAALITILLMFVAAALFAVVLGVLGMSFSQFTTEETPQFSWALVIMFAFYIIIINVVSAYYQATIRNHIFNNTAVEKVAKFTSSFDFLSLAWLHLSNLVLIMCTFALAYPWAKIRSAQYAIDHTQVELSDEKEKVIDQLGEKQTAIGDELANVFDVDIALV